MKAHKSCRSLPIYNFNEILKTSDLRFLIKDFDEFADDNKELSSSELNELEAIYKNIIYEYSELTKNKKIIANYKSRILIVENEFKYNTSIQILDLYTKTLDLDVLKLLNRLDWKINFEKEADPQVSKVISDLSSLKTKIAILKVKHDERFKDNETKEDTEYIDRLDSEAISLELGLKLSYSINTRLMSVSRWISMWNICNALNSKNNGES